MKTTKGFTIIEIILYMGLLAILITIMSSIFISILGVKLETQTNNAVQQDGKYILARLTYDIHRADKIISPALGATQTSFQLQITENSVTKVYSYSLNGDILNLSDGITTDRLNSPGTKLSLFNVVRLGNSATNPSDKDTLNLNFDVQSIGQTSSGPQIMEFHTTVSPR